MGSRFCVFVLVCWCCVLLVTGQITDPSEAHALSAIRGNLSDPWNNLRDWDQGDPCVSNWTGIICFDANDTHEYLHIKELRLMTKNLSGNLAPELGNLLNLEVLDFMWNNLTGPIPKQIGNLSSLFLLLLNGNQLSGHLPSELGLLSNLDRFQIDENNISGPIPKSFANLTKVKHIHFNNNSLSGQIPPGLSKLSELVHLLLDNNNLSGNLPPELEDLPNLRILQFDNNNFESEIPTSYGNFSNLVKLSLRNCSLRGSVPDFSRISKLRYLDLSRNNLTGEIPSNYSKGLTTIDLSDNLLDGSIPEGLSELWQLQQLSLKNNNLTGHLLTSLWLKNFQITGFKFKIDLRNNSLSDIQGDFVSPPKNVTLRLDDNLLCEKANISDISQFCGSDGKDKISRRKENSPISCDKCLKDLWVEHVLEAPVSCFCAVPLWIGYRLKSPSFVDFRPYISQFKRYVTGDLGMEPYQLSVDSFEWEEGPRLRMYLKLFPKANEDYFGLFNPGEVWWLRHIFSSWKFSSHDFFGPYELLNFTLVGPYEEESFRIPRSGMNAGVLAGIIVGVIACVVAFISVASLLISKKHAKHHGRRPRKGSSAKLSIDGVKDFAFRELAQATNNFSKITQVGRGGYGSVYKGILSDKAIVAIKRAAEVSMQGEKEFLNEIQLLSRLHHRNLVSLVGFCDDEGEQMLVYEFMPNGTLHDWLSGRAKGNLDFGQRLGIALGSAKGLLYLHTEADPPVFHRDIKPSNILLDSKLNAKVADFGLSRLAPIPQGEDAMAKSISTVVKGTPGYLDPEYFLSHRLTEKSDVYSLGVVFLELLTGMQPISQGKNIVREVNAAYQSGMMLSVVDSRIGFFSFECIERFTTLALCCSHEKPEMRPKMSVVVKELEDILKTLLEIDSSRSLESVSLMLARPSSSSPSYHLPTDPYMLNMSGSNLSSGCIPSIKPR